MRNSSHRRSRSVIHTADSIASFALLVGLALGAMIGVGVARIVGFGCAP